MKVTIRNPRGFTLLELAVVLAIIGLLLILILPTNNAMLINQRRATTQQKLVNIESAIVNYVTVNRRLPCPTDGTVVPPIAGAGSEGARDVLGDCTNFQASGVVPWVALGIAFEDIVDSWGNLITFRVGYGLTRTAALDMTACDPAGTGAPTTINAAPAVNLGLCNSATCTGTFVAANCTSPQNFLQRKGLDLKVSAASTVMDYLSFTGAAYVLISHGENGYGALINTGIYRTDPMRAVAGTTLEFQNRNVPALTVGVNAPPQFMNAPYSDVELAAQYFDDIVVAPMLFSVISKAQLGPRSH